jgi:hypothetical protein
MKKMLAPILTKMKIKKPPVFTNLPDVAP